MKCKQQPYLEVLKVNINGLYWAVCSPICLQSALADNHVGIEKRLIKR
jgi:hypothetical protein